MLPIQIVPDCDKVNILSCQPYILKVSHDINNWNHHTNTESLREGLRLDLLAVERV